MTVNDNEEDMLERILSYVDGETKIVQYGATYNGNICFNGLCIDEPKRIVVREDKEIELTYTEFEILLLLAQNGFYFPVISEKYHKELLYYYGLDDTLNFEVEKEIFVECEKYLHDKINVKELIKHPQKIYIFYNILNRMANVIDTKYFELCKKRVMSTS